jgi:DNA replication and repair protein RecF
VRAGGSAEALRTWDLELGRHALALRGDRERAVALVTGGFTRLAEDLGLRGEAELRYRPRSSAASAEAFADELAERLPGDLERGFTGHGPHRDDLVLRRDGRELRTYGSQGEQRLALLALLVAEREALEAERGDPPLLLLDDVMSELDAGRRERLVTRVTRSGQVVVTTTDLAHVPSAREPGVARIAVDGAVVLQEALAA